VAALDKSLFTSKAMTINQTINQLSEQAYDNAWIVIKDLEDIALFNADIPYERKYRREILYQQDACKHVVPEFIKLLKENGTTSQIVKTYVMGNARLKHLKGRPLFHHFIVALDGDKKLWVIDPTYQQLLSEKDQSEKKPKVLVAPIESALEELRHLGISDEYLAIWKDGIANDPDLKRWAAEMGIQVSLDDGLGGIDLTQGDKVLEVKEGDYSGGMKFNIDPAMIEQLKNAQGFVPVIINVQPITDLRKFLGLAGAGNENGKLLANAM
jgi:hypothetical protein